MARRRTVLHGAALPIAGMLTGCSKISSFFSKEPSIKEVKNNSEIIEYKELRKNISQYKDKYVHYPAADALAVVDRQGTYEYIFSLPGEEGQIFYGTWDGDPYDPNSTMEIWGVVKGSKTESYFTKSEKLVPKIKIFDMVVL